MNRHISDLTERIPALKETADDIERTFAMMRDCYRAGGKVMICGNGGSAADAEHCAGELMKGFRSKRPLSDKARKGLDADVARHLQGALPTIPLTGFLSLGSAFANDVDPQYTIAQMVWGLGRENDALIGISTSGKAKNIIHALNTAKALGMKTIALTGRDGGRMIDIADVSIRTPETITHLVQELHVPVYHCISLMLEEEFFPGM